MKRCPLWRGNRGRGERLRMPKPTRLSLRQHVQLLGKTAKKLKRAHVFAFPPTGYIFGGPAVHASKEGRFPFHNRSLCKPTNTPNFLGGGSRRRAFEGYIPQRKAAVCTGASQRRFISSSSIDTVAEQPAISSDVTKFPTSDRVTLVPAGSSNRRTASYIR